MHPLPVAEPWFDRRVIDDAITLITEPHVNSLLSANIWHVRGRDRDLLVDTGVGVGSLRAAFPELFEREPIVVVTHGHLDHQGSAHEFEDVWAHRLEDIDAQPATLRSGPLLEKLLVDAGPEIAEWGLPEILIQALPSADYDPDAYRLEPTPISRRLEHGDEVELGDRTFQVLHLPGHTPGSIGLHDRDNGVLFTGDVVYDDELIDNCVGADPRAYVTTMELLSTLDVDVVHAGHAPSFGQDRLRELAREYIDSRRPT